MSVNQPEVDRPIRVVVFGSGPELNEDAKQFIFRLEEHVEIEFLGAFCQAQSRSWGAMFVDLWARRGWLAFPLFALSVIGKVTRFLRHPRKEITLQRRLRKISDRIHFIPNLHAQDILEQVRVLNPDLGLIYGGPILRPELFEIPGLGTLGIHHGKVPEYRGNKTTFWAMYNGERTAGVTIQKVNKGLDMGSVIKTGEVSIQSRAYHTVVHELEKLGLDLYMKAILEVKHGTAEYKPQRGAKGKLYRNPKPGDLLKFWGRQLRRRTGIAK